MEATIQGVLVGITSPPWLPLDLRIGSAPASIMLYDISIDVSDIFIDMLDIFIHIFDIFMVRIFYIFYVYYVAISTIIYSKIHNNSFFTKPYQKKDGDTIPPPSDSKWCCASFLLQENQEKNTYKYSQTAKY